MGATLNYPSRLPGLDHARPALVLGRIESLIAGLLFAMAEGFTAWRMRRRTNFELGKLDDWLLRDIGLSRSDLPKAATAGDLRGIAELLTPSKSGETGRSRRDSGQGSMARP
ncbi:MAG TPA: DUF1127 domain-containing protein [Bauldia sp.]|nr:DUF1127 domain-containing protein [Bauldia sp.]